MKFARIRMSRRLGLASACTSLLIASGAQANLMNNGSFVFRGHLDKGDPVNLVFVGGLHDQLDPFCSDTQGGPDDRSASCVVIHTEVGWKRGDMRERFCDGGAHLVFDRQSGGTVNAESDKSMTTSGLCKNEFHLRVWSDSHHGHEIPVWDVGAIHHEHRCVMPIRTGFNRACHHKIDMGWETVENIAVQQLGRSQHGEAAQCTYPDYYPLVGSGPPGKTKDHYGTGRPSRISFQTINPNKPSGHKCDGA